MIKRYDISIGTEAYTNIDILEEDEDVSGDWVRHEDYEEEREKFISALASAMRYIEALEEAVSDCGHIVSDTVWDNCAEVDFNYKKAGELCEG